jgi:hypothetical protein
MSDLITAVTTDGQEFMLDLDAVSYIHNVTPNRIDVHLKGGNELQLWNTVPLRKAVESRSLRPSEVADLVRSFVTEKARKLQ